MPQAGRVQAAGFDPYQYTPAARQLVALRDEFLWHAVAQHCVAPGEAAVTGNSVTAPGCTMINRPVVPTIYPPVAEAYFLAVHYLSPAGAGTTPIQAGAALRAIAATGLLLLGLRSLGRDPRMAVLWAWCPLVALEAGNNAHVDVLGAAGLVCLPHVLRVRGGVLGFLPLYLNQQSCDNGRRFVLLDLFVPQH